MLPDPCVMICSLWQKVLNFYQTRRLADLNINYIVALLKVVKKTQTFHLKVETL